MSYDYRAHTKGTLHLFQLTNSSYYIPGKTWSAGCSKSLFGLFHRLDIVHLHVFSFYSAPPLTEKEVEVSDSSAL